MASWRGVSPSSHGDAPTGSSASEAGPLRGWMQRVHAGHGAKRGEAEKHGHRLAASHGTQTAEHAPPASPGARTCWFQSIVPHKCEWRFDGGPDRCHLIPAQRIRHAGQAHLAWDSRIIRNGCRHIHDRFDGRNAIQRVELRYEQYPESVHEFAAENGWYWAGERDGWRKEAGAA